MENPIYQCGDCKKTVYLMEAGFGDKLKCCDKMMEEMSPADKEKYLADKEPHHPRYPKPGAP